MRRPRLSRARAAAVALVLVAAAAAGALYLRVPAHYPRGDAHPAFAAGAAEAERLLRLTEPVTPELPWASPATSRRGTCSRGHFDDSANYVPTAKGHAYSVDATATGNKDDLDRALEAIRRTWRERYGADAVGERVSDPGTFYADAERPRSETRYTLSTWVRDGVLHLAVGVPGCFDDDRRRI